jgi:hypothetical protein
MTRQRKPAGEERKEFNLNMEDMNNKIMTPDPLRPGEFIEYKSIYANNIANSLANYQGSTYPDVRGDAIALTGQHDAKETGNSPSIDLVMEDLKARKEYGFKKYGVYVQANDGRDGLIDLYQELLDACVYIRKVIHENELRRGNP